MVENGSAEYSKRVVYMATVFDKLINWGIPLGSIKLIEFPLAMPNVSERFLPDTDQKPEVPQSTMEMPMMKTGAENDMRKRLLQTRLNKLIKCSTPMPLTVPVKTQLSQLMHVPVKQDAGFRNVSDEAKKQKEPSFWRRMHTEFQTTQKMRQLAAENVMDRQVKQNETARMSGAPRPTHNVHARKSRLPRPIQQKGVSSRRGVTVK